jgi:hypothetical protein
MTSGLRLRLRLLLEGIEVPVVSASLNVQPNAPAQCQIQILATDKALEFKPRTLVHLFFYDFWGGPGDTASIRVPGGQVGTLEDQQEQNAQTEAAPDTAAGPTGGGSGAIGPMLENPFEDGPPMDNTNQLMENPFSEEDDRWKLFFTGEVIGFTFSKSDQQRSIVLECLDHSVYWDTCYQYKVNVSSLTGDHMAAFVGAGTTFFDTFFASGMSYIVSAVTKRSVTQPHLTGLLSGVVRLLESVGGVYIGNEARDLYGLNPHNRRGRFKGVNDFFSIAELRLKLVYMISAAEGDESSRRHFARRAFSMWGRRRAARLGKISSFREILNSMMQFIYHSVMPCPMARYEHPEDRQVTSTTTRTTSFANTRRGRAYSVSLSDLSTRVDQIKAALQARNTVSVGSLRGIASSCDTLSATAGGIGGSDAQSILQALNSIKRAAISLIGMASDGRVTSEGGASRLATGMSADAVRAAGALRGATIRRRVQQTRSIHTGERLHSQIIKPDIFMCSPPRCNVIFPEHANSIQFNRMYMREVTRMRLKVSDQIFGPDSLLDRAYYAPDVEVMGVLPPRRRHGRGSEAGQIQGTRFRRAAYSKRIMDHELYVGVVPVFERMNEVNIYAARVDLVTHRGARIPYAIRAVNHQFFKHRWAARNMNISGRFNPYFAPGFPTLVIDRYMTKSQLDNSTQRVFDAELLTESPEVEEFDQEAFDESHRNPPDLSNATDQQSEVAGDEPDSIWNILRDTVPTQFVGLAEGVNHTLNQNSASTNVSLTHARAHRENEVLLGANEVPLTRRSMVRSNTSPSRNQGTPGRGRRRVRDEEGRAIRNTTVAALEEPQVGDVGPYAGEITAVTPSTSTGFHPLYGPHFGDRARRTWTRVQVGQNLRAVEYGPEVVGLVGSDDERVTFNAYQVTEAIDRWRGQLVEVPLEDFIRPPWMADIWRNDQIGSVYQQFFGTGAITDAMIIEAGRALMSIAEADPVAQAIADIEGETTSTGAPIASEGASVQRPGMTITIERAIDLLVRMYSTLRHSAGADIHEFIRAYTWRPIATMTEILGSRDLEINPDTGEKVSGELGLHSRAFGRGEMGRNLRNLVDEEVKTILDFDAEENRGNVLERMDKRSDKAEVVLNYVSELYDSKGLLG